MNMVLLWCAAGLSAMTFAVHTFAGGVAVARPLLDDETLPLPSKWLNYYCWHITSVLLLAMSVGYAYVARSGEGAELVVFMGASSAAFCLLSALIAMKAGVSPLKFPSTSLFAAITLVTALVFLL